MQEKLKVTVHTKGWKTAAGQVCLKHYEYWVVVGRNPLGPKGGRSGVIVDGYPIGHRFSSKEAALKHAQNIATENSYDLI